ncbi:hypothetical protein AGLY_010211 [Aphis glycines]|uniref:Uncharacterized protein n=1 Tax=Aphis glycines TaxID=307491 RepID=A0A6G0TFD2_APHGL|nr:hypothetical protein AGLY_010211 [Aphis glycines]
MLFKKYVYTFIKLTKNSDIFKASFIKWMYLFGVLNLEILALNVRTLHILLGEGSINITMSTIPKNEGLEEGNNLIVYVSKLEVVNTCSTERSINILTTASVSFIVIGREAILNGAFSSCSTKALSSKPGVITIIGKHFGLTSGLRSRRNFILHRVFLSSISFHRTIRRTPIRYLFTVTMSCSICKPQTLNLRFIIIGHVSKSKNRSRDIS